MENELLRDGKVLENIDDIAFALVAAREALIGVRNMVNENAEKHGGLKFPEHTWDDSEGLAGIALKALEDAINFFPVKFDYDQLYKDRKVNLIREMRDHIANSSAIENKPRAAELIAKADNILGD